MSRIKVREISEKKHFDAMAQNYDHNYNYDNDFFTYKKVKKLAPLKEIIEKYKTNNPAILELGCGTGEYTATLAEYFPKSQITGIDISPKILQVAIKKCKDYSNVKFLTRSAYTLNFPKGKFDIVCGFYIAHHLDLKKMFSEVEKVIKPSGIAYFIEPNILNPVVFLIKNISFLKKAAGDSPEETAINPLTIKESLPKGLAIKSIDYSEFTPPSSFLSDSLLKKIDKFTSMFSYIPGLQLLAGSLIIEIVKL